MGFAVQPESPLRLAYLWLATLAVCRTSWLRWSTFAKLLLLLLGRLGHSDGCGVAEPGRTRGGGERNAARGKELRAPRPLQILCPRQNARPDMRA